MPFKKGQSGNPGGSPNAAKRSLANSFVRTLRRKWEAHGDKVIDRLIAEDPAAFVRAVTAVLPKDVSIEAAVNNTIDVRGLPATSEWLKQFRTEREKPKLLTDNEGSFRGNSNSSLDRPQ
jgi:hypothetical protein